MADVTLTFSNPTDNYSGTGGLEAEVKVTSFDFDFAIGRISSGRCTVSTDVVSKYFLESNPTTNPLHIFSQIRASLGGVQFFSGRVDEKTLRKGANETSGSLREMDVDLIGFEGALAESFCVDASGNEIWTLKTDTVEVGATSPYLPLLVVEGGNYGSFVSDTLWPDPNDVTGAKCWLQDSDCPFDTLNTGITNVETITPASPKYIELTTTKKGFAPQGFVFIETGGSFEAFGYLGYDPTGTGDAYRIKLISRAQLGTTAIAHTSGVSVVRNKICKDHGPEPSDIYIDPAGGTTFTKLREGDDYTRITELGIFALTVAAGGTDAYAGHFWVYDIDQTLDATSTVISPEDVIVALASGPVEYGGAGFVDPTDFTITATGLKITRYDYDPDDKPLFAWAAIQDFIKSLNLSDDLVVLADHVNEKIVIKMLEQQGSLDYLFTHVQQVTSAISNRDVYSCVRVEYTYDQEPNLINPDWSHHGNYGAAPLPNRWRYCTSGAADWQDGTNSTLESPAAQDDQFGMAALVDGKLDSKLKAEFDGQDPAGSFDFGHFWFSDTPAGTPDTIRLDEIELHVGAYRMINSTRSTRNENDTMIVRLEGAEDYDTTSFTATAWYDLGKRLETTVKADGASVKLEMDQFLLRYVNAVRIVFDYMPGPKTNGDWYWGVVHLFRLRGNVTKYSLIQTTDDAADKTNPAYLYVPSTHKKVRGGIGADTSAGKQRGKHVAIGAASDEAAITVGRAYLERSIKTYNARNYKFLGTISAIPELGSTCGADETGTGASDYNGILRNINFSSESIGQRSLTFRTMNYDSSDLT